MTKLINEVRYMNPITGSTDTGENWMELQKDLGEEGGFPLEDLEKLCPNDMDEIALCFINRHKHNLQDWFLQAKDLAAVYYNLIGGAYGEITRPFPEKYPDDYEIEISSVESVTGNAIIFEFERADEELNTWEKENIDALHNVKFRYHSLAMTRLKTITEITKKYKKWENGGLPDGMSIEMLHNELIRLHDIASGQHYFDYEKQKWVDAA
jgi:hypothetical protein